MPATHVEAALSNGHDPHVHSSPVANKKAKGKRGMDSTEASRLLQARISQLEQDAAGEKDQEMEIVSPRPSEPVMPSRKLEVV
ncbi:taxilin [Trichoderma cornu-damae]|uniref:Taxilin n=1 Tax=Trichoderma cornu-damae TaxID=654480 RepID=A0A9P8QZ85_9HYPO|nr:taxilin [Trichoderma cornu-damae]